MASIKAILRINEIGNGVIESVTTNVETNNISTIPYATDVTNWFLKQTTQNRDYGGATVNVLGSGAEYGYSKYGVKNTSTNTYSSGYKGLMFPCPSNLQSDFTLTIVGTDVLSFNIHFDNSMGQYPTNYTVYSSISGTTTTYTNDDNVIEISDLLAGHGTTIITITGWSLQNVPIGITFFENVELNLEIDKTWIDDFETQSQKTSDGESIQYGVLANTGSITLKDKDKTLLEKSKMGYLNVYLFALELYVNNKLLQKHISNSAPYFTDNYTMKLELTNEIMKYQNTYVEKTSYGTMYDIFIEILSKYYGELNIEYKDMLLWTPNGNSNINVLNYLKSFETLEISYSDNVLELLNKICNALALNIYLSDNNKIVVSSARPRMATTESIITIPYQKQYSDFDYSIVVTNRYDRVFFDDETTNPNYKNAITLKTNEFYSFTNKLNVFDQSQYTIGTNGWIINTNDTLDITGDIYITITFDSTDSGQNNQIEFRLFDGSETVYSNIETITTPSSTLTIHYVGHITSFLLFANRNVSNFKVMISLEQQLNYIPYETPITDIISNSILEDYSNGIKTAKISVFPSDLYTTSGVLAKKWNMGQILEVDDIIKVESKDGNNIIYDKNGNDVYWRIVDRKVKYEGQILIDLILQEIKN